MPVLADDGDHRLAQCACEVRVLVQRFAHREQVALRRLNVVGTARADRVDKPDEEIDRIRFRPAIGKTSQKLFENHQDRVTSETFSDNYLPIGAPRPEYWSLIRYAASVNCPFGFSRQKRSMYCSTVLRETSDTCCLGFA